MAYYHPYSYTCSPSSGWDYSARLRCYSPLPFRRDHLVPSQAGPSALSYTSYTEDSSLFNSPIHADPREIPISGYSTLAGALTPVDRTPQEGARPAPQQVQRQLVQPVSFTLAGPASFELVQPPRVQPRQPVSPQLAAPSNQGVPTQPAAPQPAPSNRRQTAYRYANPPARHPRQPAGAVRVCGIGACSFSTAEGGKKFARHRATHFPGQVGAGCPACGQVFSRSDTCGKHLRRCDPQAWRIRAMTKGTQDSWGERIGQNLVRPS